MSTYNYSRLLGKIKEHGFTQESLAEKVGISVCSLNLSLNNKRGFRQAEILKICDILNIPVQNVADYFFS